MIDHNSLSKVVPKNNNQAKEIEGEKLQVPSSVTNEDQHRPNMNIGVLSHLEIPPVGKSPNSNLFSVHAEIRNNSEARLHSSANEHNACLKSVMQEKEKVNNNAGTNHDQQTKEISREGTSNQQQTTPKYNTMPNNSFPKVSNNFGRYIPNAQKEKKPHQTTPSPK